LDKATPGSAVELAAKNQRAQLYESMERGRRFKPVMSPGTSAAQLKEWASIRADAWKLFSAGRHREAEPIYRRMLALNPRDAVATHQLGLTLMELGQCEDALAVFGNMSNLNPSEEDYADTLFRMGQCYVELEQWDDALVHFQTLYDTAIEFEENNKDVTLPGGMRVLDKAKIVRWLEKVRPHVPDWLRLNGAESRNNGASGDPLPSSPLSDEVLYADAVQRVKPQKALDAGAALVGRDADFSWFRFVIPASKVVRDDYPTGAHEFIPLNPGDTFFTTQPEIYLVFGLVAASYDAVSLSAQCFVEVSESIEDQRAAAQDRVMTAMNDQSGYFMLTPPDKGWAPGLYRCGLFAGERASASTSVDEVRFRIVDPS
jgi:tetratricopeptide (TPR) repeat protein